jgi:hypothetical protein
VSRGGAIKGADFRRFTGKNFDFEAGCHEDGRFLKEI